MKPFLIMTYETRDGKVTIEKDRDDFEIHTLAEEVIKPLLISGGYHPDNVNELLDCV